MWGERNIRSKDGDEIAGPLRLTSQERVDLLPKAAKNQQIWDEETDYDPRAFRVLPVKADKSGSGFPKFVRTSF
ncbi:MAG: hypothetical protein Q7R49_00705 [Candidatus Daviesbacteria bacterium]|nr:hypothetical protein [Candidatus Daviesbacteria bacterium]